MNARRLAPLLLGLLAGCGEREPTAPPLPMGKVPPTLTRRVRGHTLEEWLTRAGASEAATRAEAPWALAELAGDVEVLRPVLERLVADPSPEVRYAALVAVGRFPGDLGASLSAALVEGLRAPERGTRELARASLPSLGERAAAPLGAALRWPREDDALEAARILAALGPRAVAAAPDLARTLGGESLALRLYASRALESLGAAGLPALEAALRGARGESALALLELFEALGPRASAALEAILEKLADGSAEVASAAEKTLASVGPTALARLEALAASEDPRAAAAGRVAARIREAPPR